ncbi:MAG: flagellar assembly protein FliW [Homoserinimonas sp.]
MTAVLTFTTPPPGLAPLVDFILDDVGGAAGIYALHAASDPSIRLYVLDAAVYLPWYTPEITDEQALALGVTAPEDAMVLVVANPSESGTTTNLMAPIVVNSRSGRCAQLILEGQDWPLRAELTARSA